VATLQRAADFKARAGRDTAQTDLGWFMGCGERRFAVKYPKNI